MIKQFGFIKTMPWNLVIFFYISTVVIGIFVGAPIATKYYNLTIPNEVGELFFLLPITNFFLMLPICMLAAVGSQHKYLSGKKYLKIMYFALCSFMVPLVFYGVTVSLYYK